eukprot:scaffold525_cov307-Pavlova_lutheri.AAC.5
MCCHLAPNAPCGLLQKIENNLLHRTSAHELSTVSIVDCRAATQPSACEETRREGGVLRNLVLA